MLSLNILSPEEKKKSAQLWKYLLMKKLMLAILIITIIMNAILFGAKIILKQKLDEVKKQNQMINISNTKINEKIESYNDRIRIVNLIQKDFIPWSKVLYFFNGLITPGIHIDDLIFDLGQNNFSIKGTADTRKDLLYFKDKINSCADLNKITLPLNTILRKENINFDISVTFKKNLKETNLDKLSCQKNEE